MKALLFRQLVLAGGLLAFLGIPAAQAQDAKYEVVYLDQGWTKDERQQYYRTSQGSALLSYDVFLNLEQAKSDKPFRADENMVRYGLVPQPANPGLNPDALPIGWTKTVVTEGRWKGEWAGISCSACHNGQLEYKGNKIRIDGGVNLTFDLYAFVRGLDDAVAAAVADPKKFDRLADKLGRRDDAGKAELRKRVEAEAAYLHRVRTGYVSSSDVGPGRMDAITLVHNQVVSHDLGAPENWIPTNAPVKWPFLLERPPVGLDRLEGNPADSPGAQRRRVHGRLGQDRPDLEDAGRGTVRFHDGPQGPDPDRDPVAKAGTPYVARGRPGQDRPEEGGPGGGVVCPALRLVPLAMASPLERAEEARQAVHRERPRVGRVRRNGCGPGGEPELRRQPDDDGRADE